MSEKPEIITILEPRFLIKTRKAVYYRVKLVVMEHHAPENVNKHKM